jgi:glycine C-acetyltransferase
MNKDFVVRIAGELDEIKNAGLFKNERILSSRQGAEITVNEKTVINFLYYNYILI